MFISSGLVFVIVGGWSVDGVGPVSWERDGVFTACCAGNIWEHKYRGNL